MQIILVGVIILIAFWGWVVPRVVSFAADQVGNHYERIFFGLIGEIL